MWRKNRNIDNTYKMITTENTSATASVLSSAMFISLYQM